VLTATTSQLISTINFNKFSLSEKEHIISQLSQFNIDLLTDEKINKLKENIENRKKGWSNFLRKGVSKVHRCLIPNIISWHKLYGSQKQPLLQMFHRFKKHDHQRNELLINYREQKGMRLNIRSERQEMYQALDLAILYHLDIDSFGTGLFEITCSVEVLAKTINIYRIDEKGHARYDTLLNAINDYEKTKQIIVYRAFDKENKVYKPMRIWLTLEFFKSRGYTEEELRNLLKSRSHYLHKKGFYNKAREKYQTDFLTRLKKAGVSELSNNITRKLIKIKNKLLDLHYEEKAIKKATKQKKEKLQQQQNKSYAYIYSIYSTNTISPAQSYLVQEKVSKRFAELTKLDDEFWYRCLIEIGWTPSS
jgi:hypothetical protein